MMSMRAIFQIFLLLAAVLLVRLSGQDVTPIPPALSELQRALSGSWTGVLEYRDFSEPANSTKRVKLPTWLSIEPSGTDLRFRYVYDDGPTKTVTETALVRIDPAAGRYIVMDSAGKLDESYAISGFAQLKQGRGALILTGAGRENHAKVDIRTTLRIGRNILEITRETAVAGQPFNFRHSYTLVRATPP